MTVTWDHVKAQAKLWAEHRWWDKEGLPILTVEAAHEDALIEEWIRTRPPATAVPIEALKCIYINGPIRELKYKVPQP